MDIAGSTVGSYRIVRRLGEGGMGTVYLAEHALLGRRAALKVLLPAYSSQPEIVARFFNEARVTTSIADPGIVQVFDFGHHTDGSAFIVMELLDGESVDARLARRGRLAAAEAVRLVRQIATSLAAAHARGVVHRDLKPENLFIVADAAVAGGERTKILDFGIAKLAGDEPGRMKTRTGAIIGTPTYMSPEQCRGLGQIDQRSDVYALGCVLFCMLTGAPPFDGDGLGDIIYAHLGQPAPAPSTRAPAIEPALDEVVRRCLAKAPADRFQSMGEVDAALAALAQRSAGTVVAVIEAPPSAWHLPRAAATTLGAATGQQPVPTAALRGPGRGVTLIAAAASGLLVIVIVLLARSGGDQPAASPRPAVIVDGGAVPIDAAVAAPVPDAAAAFEVEPTGATTPATAVPSPDAASAPDAAPPAPPAPSPRPHLRRSHDRTPRPDVAPFDRRD